MEEKHTRGPWEPVTDRQYSDLPYIVIGAGASDAKSVEWMPLYVQVGGRSGWVEQKANTLLIAAAPELLAALKKVAQALEWHAHGCCRGFDDGAPLPTSEAVELAKRTIAKATGRVELYRAHDAALAQQPAVCPKCDGTGEADSGGIYPWGAPATIPCDCQQPAAVDARIEAALKLLHPHLDTGDSRSAPVWAIEIYAALVGATLATQPGGSDNDH